MFINTVFMKINVFGFCNVVLFIILPVFRSIFQDLLDQYCGKVIIACDCLIICCGVCKPVLMIPVSLFLNQSICFLIAIICKSTCGYSQHCIMLIIYNYSGGSTEYVTAKSVNTSKGIKSLCKVYINNTSGLYYPLFPKQLH
jgi:K+-transporting ATPase A subunit